MVSALILAACGSSAEQTAPAQSAPMVQIALAARAAPAGAVRASGLVSYKRETPLSFSAPGVIVSLLVDEGDSVRAGQRLASLRRTVVGSNAQEAALARATAERDLARVQALYDRGFASQAALDDARLGVERARDAASLTAPAAGLILRRTAEPSQTVAAGQPVLIFGDVSSGLIVRASVASSDAARMRVGDGADIRVGDLPARAGRVARIAAKSEEATGAFDIEISIADPAGLRSGMVAQAVIAAASEEGAQTGLVVPTLSLLDARADQGVVFVVGEDGLARRRSVRTGGLSQEGVTIIGGLEAGERVVAAGAAYVRDGEPVRIAPDPS